MPDLDYQFLSFIGYLLISYAAMYWYGWFNGRRKALKRVDLKAQIARHLEQLNRVLFLQGIDLRSAVQPRDVKE